MECAGEVREGGGARARSSNEKRRIVESRIESAKIKPFVETFGINLSLTP
jgi:hypothetical protein